MILESASIALIQSNTIKVNYSPSPRFTVFSSTQPSYTGTRSLECELPNFKLGMRFTFYKTQRMRGIEISTPSDADSTTFCHLTFFFKLSKKHPFKMLLLTLSILQVIIFLTLANSFAVPAPVRNVFIGEKEVEMQLENYLKLGNDIIPAKDTCSMAGSM